jgi:hypothetical protein
LIAFFLRKLLFQKVGENNFGKIIPKRRMISCFLSAAEKSGRAAGQEEGSAGGCQERRAGLGAAAAAGAEPEAAGALSRKHR